MEEFVVYLLIEDDTLNNKLEIIGYYRKEYLSSAKRWVKEKSREECEYFLVPAIWLKKS